MWHIRVVLKAEFSDNNRAAAVSISPDSAEIRLCSRPKLRSGGKAIACGCEHRANPPPDSHAPLSETAEHARGPAGERQRLFCFQRRTPSRGGLRFLRPHPDSPPRFNPLLDFFFLDASRWGQESAPGEHRAKHLSSSESDPQSRRVDRVHCGPSSELKRYR